MPDNFTQSSNVGYGKRIINSIGGIFFGVVLFFASFVVLFNNEGSVDYSNIAKTAVQVDPAIITTDSALTDKLLAVTGPIDTTDSIGDDLYLKPGKYVAIKRNVEMYSWIEETETDTSEDVGGGQSSTTNYTYKKDWSSSPEESSDFKYPEGHLNPPLTMEEVSKRANKVNVGAYEIDMPNVSLPQLSELNLSAENTEIIDNAKLSSPYIFTTKNTASTIEAPQIGDIRVSYSVLKPETSVTVFGKLTGKLLGTYLDKNNNKLFQIFIGTKEQAISDLHSEYTTWLWIWRLVGFFMMMIGLQMIVAPINVLASVLPFLGQISRGIIGIVAFIVALVLSTATILISMVFHNVLALIVVIIAVIAGAVYFINIKKTQSNTSPLSPTPPQNNTTSK